MTTQGTSQGSPDLPLRDRLCEIAIEHFGRFGFDESMLEMSIAADVDVHTLVELFGSPRGAARRLRRLSAIVDPQGEDRGVDNPDPRSWFAEIADIESFAPMMSYLVRTLERGDDSGRTLFDQMTDNAEHYLEEAVRAGTIKPSRDPRARARFLTMTGGGGFLLYLRMHHDPSGMGAVLRDYAREIMTPALELYTYGLMTEDTMYQAFAARCEQS